MSILKSVQCEAENKGVIVLNADATITRVRTVWFC